MKIDLDTLEDAYFTYFTSSYGLSIDSKGQSILFFERTGRLWDFVEFQRAEISECEKLINSPREFVGFGRLSFDAAVGMTVKNVVERSKADACTGLKVMMKDIGLPSFFMAIRDRNELDKAYQAVAQFLRGEISGSYTKLPDDIKVSIQSSNAVYEQQENEPEELVLEGNRLPWGIISLISALFILTILVLIGGQLGI